MRFRNIIFDFDGTLVDSRPGVVNAFKKVAEELTSKKLKGKEVTQLIGKPLAQTISILLDTADEILIQKGCALFKKYYAREGVYQNIVYPGIKEMIKSFKNRSLDLFVVSNKIELFMNKILEQHNLKEYFIAAMGTDGTDWQSKKADYVKYLVSRYKLKRKETALVGDTENDVVAARQNSIYSIGITWGYGSKIDLITAKANAICHSPLELKQFIFKNGETN